MVQKDGKISLPEYKQARLGILAAVFHACRVAWISASCITAMGKPGEDCCAKPV
ncbi:hypothetical protein CAter282_4507 [Collimonas arenae]|uniref:Uncharacterized protein n=1 Tax=Collimonas arenae TaxID=279058 RepID=A0A127QQD4_9BURK|nr:hypothetical protein CAter10_4905 [Collimonas arenae]AMP12167.1 hypothetical protein CAter282_4507 [Collimonas arenae]